MRLSIREMTLVSLFTALAVAASVVLRFGGAAMVPYSLLPFVVLMAGALLGGRLGALSMTVYLLLGLVGIPVFAKPPYGGLTYVLQPTFGFTLGYIGGAYIVGKVLAVWKEPSWLRYFIASVAGLAVLYAIGLPYLYIILNFYLGKAVPIMGVLNAGFFPFILFDLGKAALAAFIARPVARQVRLATTAGR